MADDKFKAFIEAVAADSSLQEKLNRVTDADAVVAIAKEAGLVISAEAAEDLFEKSFNYVKNLDKEELTDEQLEAVAGGRKSLEELKDEQTRGMSIWGKIKYHWRTGGRYL